MEKTLLLIQINSRFLQSSLSIPYLSSYIDTFDICKTHILECSINDSSEDILEKISSFNAEIIGFSCYIWNIELTVKLMKMIRVIFPDAVIICGGPEASFRDTELIENGYADFVIRGEGEQPLHDILEHVINGKELQYSDYISFNYNGKMNSAKLFFENNDIDSIPSVFLNERYCLEKPFVYIETSRGCPYNCSYCSSSNTTKVRNFSMERVKKEILFLIDKPNIETIRFIDRTFNHNESRAIEIIEFIKKHNTDKVFQMEIKPDIATEKFLECLKGDHSKYIQFEIGIQSTAEETLKAVNRIQNIQKACEFLDFLKKHTEVHLHVDLIAGLPLEDHASFLKSLDTVAEVFPHTIQLGILKILPGSPLKEFYHKYDIKYNPDPPYQVFSNNAISYSEMIELSQMEKLINIVYNSGSAYNFIVAAVTFRYKSFSALFRALYSFWKSRNISFHSNSRRKIYVLLMEFIDLEIKKEENEMLCETLMYDFFITAKTNENFPCSEIVHHKKKNRFSDPFKNPKYTPSVNRHLKKHIFSYNIEATIRSGKIVKYNTEREIYFSEHASRTEIVDDEHREVIEFIKTKPTMEQLQQEFSHDILRKCFEKRIIS